MEYKFGVLWVGFWDLLALSAATNCSVTPPLIVEYSFEVVLWVFRYGSGEGEEGGWCEASVGFVKEVR